MITKKQQRIERLIKRGALVEKGGRLVWSGVTVGRHSLQQTGKSGTPSLRRLKARRKAANHNRRINRSK